MLVAFKAGRSDQLILYINCKDQKSEKVTSKVSSTFACVTCYVSVIQKKETPCLCNKFINNCYGDPFILIVSVGLTFTFIYTFFQYKTCFLSLEDIYVPNNVVIDVFGMLLRYFSGHIWDLLGTNNPYPISHIVIMCSIDRIDRRT